ERSPPDEWWNSGFLVPLPLRGESPRPFGRAKRRNREVHSSTLQCPGSPLEWNGYSCSRSVLYFVCSSFSIQGSCFEVLEKHEPCQFSAQGRIKNCYRDGIWSALFARRLRIVSYGEKTVTKASLAH